MVNGGPGGGGGEGVSGIKLAVESLNAFGGPYDHQSQALKLIRQPRGPNVHPSGSPCRWYSVHTAYYRMAIYGAPGDRLVRLPLHPPLDT